MITPLVTRERRVAISRHNRGLHPNHHNLAEYLHRSERRYMIAIARFNVTTATKARSMRSMSAHSRRVPARSRALRVQITVAEEYRYYDGAG